MTEPLTNIEYAKLRHDLDHGAPTPDLDTWRRAEAADPNFRWRVSEGHVMNALDQALDRIEELETALANHEVLKEEMKRALPAIDHWRGLALAAARGAYEALAAQAEAGKLPPVRIEAEDGIPVRVHVSEWLRRIARDIPEACG